MSSDSEVAVAKPSRRQVLAGLSAFGAGLALWSDARGAQRARGPVNSRLYHVRRFYYDSAGSANPIAMQGLKTLLGGTSHIVFGTDVPYGTSAQIRTALDTVGFSAAEIRGIERDNALTILPSARAR